MKSEPRPKRPTAAQSAKKILALLQEAIQHLPEEEQQRRWDAFDKKMDAILALRSKSEPRHKKKLTTKEVHAATLKAILKAHNKAYATGDSGLLGTIQKLKKV